MVTKHIQTHNSQRPKQEPKTTRILAAPDAVSIVSIVPSDDEVQDPFLIQLTWAASENASLYIVEFYPLNRQPRPGEDNFFRTVSCFISYTVRRQIGKGTFSQLHPE